MIAIIAILATLLLSALNQARDRATGASLTYPAWDQVLSYNSVMIYFDNNGVGVFVEVKSGKGNSYYLLFCRFRVSKAIIADAIAKSDRMIIFEWGKGVEQHQSSVIHPS